MFSSGAMKSKVDLLDASRMLFAKGYQIYATAGTAAFLNAHGVTTEAVYWPDERPDAENNVMTMIADHAFDLIVNIPKNHTKRELTNGYKYSSWCHRPQHSVDYQCPSGKCLYRGILRNEAEKIFRLRAGRSTNKLFAL